MFPFLLGSLYALYRFRILDGVNLLLMFFSLISFDMATTAINNYMDHRTAVKRSGYGFERHNAMARYGIRPAFALAAIALLLVTAAVLGFLLYLATDVLVLLLGLVSFGVGVTYTFGPMPTSRTPFSEALSGLTMGFLIPFLACYVHIWDLGLYGVSLEDGVLRAHASLEELWALFLFALPSVAGIANIMLANNICDREDDRENGRFTLPISIGLPRSLALFRGLYLLAYLAIGAAVPLGVAPPSYLLALLGVFPVWRNTARFCAAPSKEDTFPLAVKSFVLTDALRLLALGLGMLF